MLILSISCIYPCDFQIGISYESLNYMTRMRRIQNCFRSLFFALMDCLPGLGEIFGFFSK